MSDYRPDPDELLKKITRQTPVSGRGRLKVFFGMCPGVGKTYAMLKAAEERQASGTEVLIGIVETHGRSETEALVHALPTLPRKKLDYKATVLEEFDLDEALIRKPALILMDELAHTNAPGTRHPKRYQDIEELLHAGIDVYTTVNVQHIASRVDLVYQITGVPVRETVPDAFLERAAEIEIIDISPEKLLKRLREGKVYLGDRADRAAENFFKEETLIALRELALRFTAEMVDERLRDQMVLKGIAGPWNTNERLMVAVSPSPLSSRLIRATRRMAHNLEAPWVALYVDTGHLLSNEQEITLKKNLDAARELGAELITRKDTSVLRALTAVAREKNVTQIVMGRPDRRLFKDLFTGGNLLDRLVKETSEIDIHIIRQKRKPQIVGFRLKLPDFNSTTKSYVLTGAYIAVVAGINFLCLPWIGYRAIGFMFLLAVLPVSFFAGLGPNLVAAILTSLIWDYCFIPPLFTFAIREFQDAMMIVTYFAVATVAGMLARRIRKQEDDLGEREKRAAILYEFERSITETSLASEIAKLGSATVHRIFESRSAVLVWRNQELILLGASGNETLTEKEMAVAQWAFSHQKIAGKGTDTLFSSECLCFPLKGRTEPIGVLVLHPVRNLTLMQENLIETISNNLANALERELLEKISQRTILLEESEKMHQTLLNSVSHELRTPLTAISGVASALQNPKSLAEKDKIELLQNLKTSAERLGHTVENLLDMSRVSNGFLQIQKDYFEINDFIRSWSAKARDHYASHSITLALLEDDLYVKGDEKLLESVMNNLVGNAVNYSEPGSEITIRTGANEASVEIRVEDTGPGISDDLQNKIFEPFVRGNLNQKGIGLGLSIVKAIVEAHAGKIKIQNRDHARGAVSVVELPRQILPKEFGGGS